MRQNIILFYLVTIIIVACITDLHAKTTDMIWWNEESAGKGSAAFPEPAEGLRLYHGKFPDGRREIDSLKLRVLKDGGIWIKGPDGGVSKASPSADNGSPELGLTTESGPAKQAGLYIMGMHVSGNDLDLGAGKHVHYYAKYLMDLRGDAGAETSAEDRAADAFFNDPNRMALEIGPFYKKDAKRSSMGAGFLETRKKHRLRILYKGLPLGNADVDVITEDGWERMEKTDPRGFFSILPVESGKGNGNVLCAVFHRDPATGEKHSATLMLHVFKPASNWKDRFLTFAFHTSWIVCLSVLYVLYRINKRKKLDVKIMLEFEKYKIQKA